MSVDVAPRRPKTFRLPGKLVAALEAAAEDREVPQTEIVEEALRRALGVAEEGSAAGPMGGALSPGGAGRVGGEPSPDGAASAGTPASPQPRIDLVTWLSGRTGMPKALLHRFVRQGRVTVRGMVYSDELVDPAGLDDVRLDGEAV